MAKLKCKLELKTPCHIGFKKKGKQLLDDQERPYVPGWVLNTQIFQEAVRFASVGDLKIEPPHASDALIPPNEEPKILEISGEEHFKNTLYFTITVKDKELPIYLAALKSLQNMGVGANTSRGFGYNKITILDSDWNFARLKESNSVVTEDLLEMEEGDEKFYQPRFIKLAPKIFTQIERNWKSWAGCYKLGRFESRYFYKVKTKDPKELRRGTLRDLLIKVSGVEHKGELTTCGPKEEPCFVCKLFGYLGYKSHIILRSFPKATFLIGENLSEKERKKMKEALEEGGYDWEIDRVEGLADYLSP